MTIKFLADENFDHKTLAGIRRREPSVDIVAVQEVGLRQTDDPEVLEWAAQAGRIVATHDVSTFPPFARERVAAGQPMPGIIAIPESVPRAIIIDELILIASASIADDWKGRRALPPAAIEPRRNPGGGAAPPLAKNQTMKARCTVEFVTPGLHVHTSASCRVSVFRPTLDA